MTKDKFQPEEGYVIPENSIEVWSEGKTIAIRYDIAKCEEEKDPDTGEVMPQQYEANFVRVNVPLNYSKLVSAIVTDKYTMDAQIAMLANKGDDNEEHQASIAEFEAWRAHAKEVAKIITA